MENERKEYLNKIKEEIGAERKSKRSTKKNKNAHNPIKVEFGEDILEDLTEDE